MTLSTRHTLDGDADSEEQCVLPKPVAAARSKTGTKRATDITASGDNREYHSRSSEEYELVDRYAKLK